TQCHANHLAHGEFAERFLLLRRQFWNETHCPDFFLPPLKQTRLQHRERQGYQQARTVETECPVDAARLDLHLTASPTDTLSNRIELDRHTGACQLSLKNVGQQLIALRNAEGSVTFNLLVGAQPLHQPMNTNQARICRMKSGHVFPGPLY